MLELPYEPIKYEINAGNIGNFKLSRFKRNIRELHVNDIKASLENGDHFHMPLAVFKTGNGGYEISATTESEAIDGNHRLTAIQKWLSKNPKEAIQVLLMVYKIDKNVNVNVRKIFHAVNIGRKQNTDDYIRAYKDTIPIFNKLTTSRVIPCSIYGNRDEMKFYHVVGGYIRAKQNGNFKGTWTGTPKDFVDEARKLTDADVDVMEEFWEDFTKMFSLKGVQNIRNLACCKTTGFAVMFYIWMHNKDRLGRDIVIQKVRDKLEGTSFFEELARSPGISNSKKVLDAFVRRLNKSNKKYEFRNQ